MGFKCGGYIGKGALKRAVCAKTVEFIHLLAPAASAADRTSIKQALRRGEIFTGVSKENKKAIERELLSLTVIIPTIKSLTVLWQAVGSCVGI
jgi:hypothetical protein